MASSLEQLPLRSQNIVLRLSVLLTVVRSVADIVGLGQDILVNDPAAKFQRGDSD